MFERYFVEAITYNRRVSAYAVKDGAYKPGKEVFVYDVGFYGLDVALSLANQMRDDLNQRKE